MSKERLLTYLVAVLLVMNLCLVAGFLLIPKQVGPHEAREKNLQETFDFDEKQMASFKKIRIKHMNDMRSLRNELAEKSSDYYQSVVKPREAEADSLLVEINVINEDIYQLNYQHFEDLAKICRKDQLPYLEQFIGHLLRKEKGFRK